MANFVKTEGVSMPLHEEEIVKQERDHSPETWTNISGPSYQMLIDCKTEITHQIHVKNESQESHEDEDWSSLDSEHVNPLKFEAYETSIREGCEEVNCVDPDKLSSFIAADPYFETKYFENYNYEEYMECGIKKNDSLDELSKNSVNSPVGHGEEQTGEKRFVCDVCNKIFNTKKKIIRHFKIHTGEKNFSCDICNKVFKHFGHLTLHNKIHTGKRSFSCDLCHKKFTQRIVLVRHKRTHTGEKPFSCDLCCKKFAQKGALTRHKRSHTGEKPFPCDLCDKRFALNSNLICHRRLHTGEKLYSCDLCHKQYINRRSLVQHRTRHIVVSGIKCDDNIQDSLEKLSKESPVGHGKRQIGQKRFVCDICNRTFSSKRHLTVHIRRHMGEKPFSCDICDKKFTVNGDLARHKRSHTGEKPYSCDLCDQQFKQKRSLKKHIGTHTGFAVEDSYGKTQYFEIKEQIKCENKIQDSLDKLPKESPSSRIGHEKKQIVQKCFVCDICNKTFSSKRYLIVHVRRHMGEKPFSCDMCDKKFTVNSDLVRHKRTHTGEKPYSCDLCDQQFRQQGNLKKHIRTHTEFTVEDSYGKTKYLEKKEQIKCDDKIQDSLDKFPKESSPVGHEKGQIDYKRFVCDVCNKSYSSKKNLIVHVRRHTGEKPFSCDMCDKQFTTNSDLTRHKRIHTGKKSCS